MNITHRMCIGCRKISVKQDFIRMVRMKNGDTFIDTTYKAQGRGFYICKNIACFDKARKKKTPVINDEMYENLKNYRGYYIVKN